MMRTSSRICSSYSQITLSVLKFVTFFKWLRAVGMKDWYTSSKSYFAKNSVAINCQGMNKENISNLRHLHCDISALGNHSSQWNGIHSQGERRVWKRPCRQSKVLSETKSLQKRREGRKKCGNRSFMGALGKQSCRAAWDVNPPSI